jgi:hypothetical protein
METGYNVVILDNLHNSSMEALRRIEGIVGKQIPFENVDLCDFEAVKKVFEKYPIDSVIHFAGLKVLFPWSWSCVSVNALGAVCVFAGFCFVDYIDCRRLGRVERFLWSIIVSTLEAVSIWLKQWMKLE